VTTHTSATAREHEPHVDQTTRTADASESIVEINEADSSQEKIEALAEIICRAGDESAGALFVLMGMLQNSSDPQAFANRAKHFAFTRCGELNAFGMVDAQVAVLESELLAGDTLVS